MLCNNCLDYIPTIKPPRCTVCGRPVKKGKRCQYCLKEVHIDHGRGWLLFVQPVDKIIHHFKYRSKINLAPLLGQAMSNIIKADHALRNADIVVPVPLFWWKRLRRGYNQSTLLARIVADECGMQTADLLKRTKNTRTQTRLGDKARKKNVAGAFSVRSNDVTDCKVLIIDDVMTTGATVNECARVLKAAGAKKVYSCVAAITPG